MEVIALICISFLPSSSIISGMEREGAYRVSYAGSIRNKQSRDIEYPVYKKSKGSFLAMSTLSKCLSKLTMALTPSFLAT